MITESDAIWLGLVVLGGAFAAILLVIGVIAGTIIASTLSSIVG